jgi:hypothetical protein
MERIRCYRPMTRHAPRVIERAIRATTRLLPHTRGACRAALVTFREDERSMVSLLHGFGADLPTGDPVRIQADGQALGRLAPIVGRHGSRVDRACFGR